MDLQKQNNELGSAPLMPLIAKYAIPSIISMLVGALYNLTDQIFIGRIVGVVGNAASNVAFPTMTLSTALCMLLGIGTAANFNIAQGNPTQGLIVSLSRQGLFLIPLLIILPQFMGIHGILAASPISDTLAFIISVTMVLVSFKKLR